MLALYFSGQKQGSADQTFMCKLCDGTPTRIVKATNEGKKCKASEIQQYGLSLAGFLEPHPFLQDYFDLGLRKDGFLDRILLCCPKPLRLMPEECSGYIQKLDEMNVSLHSLDRLFNDIFQWHLTVRDYK